MATARELLSRSRVALTKWPALWLPAIMVNAFESLASVPLASEAAYAIVVVTANLAGFIINAGWLRMIGRALGGDRPTFNDFKSGVNDRWVPILLGNIAFVLLLGAVAGALFYAGELRYTSKALIDWFQHFQAMSVADKEAALQPDKIPAAVRGWMMLLMTWLSAAGIASFLLLYWQPLVVLRGKSWWRAWWASAALSLRRFFKTLFFALLNVIAGWLALMLTASGNGSDNALFALFGLVMLLAVMVYFKILYTAVVLDAFPAPAVDQVA